MLGGGVGGLVANALRPVVSRFVGDALSIKSSDGTKTIFEVWTKALPSDGRLAHLYYRNWGMDASEGTIEDIARIDDAGGAPMFKLPSEGGFWFQDAVKFVVFTAGEYVRGIAMDYGNSSQNRAPMLVFGNVANSVSGITEVVANGVTVTLNAGKGAFLRLRDNYRFQFSLPVEVPTLYVNDRAIFGGTGDPEGVQTAEQGTVFISDTGIYRKSTNGGNTGWVAVGA